MQQNSGYKNFKKADWDLFILADVFVNLVDRYDSYDSYVFAAVAEYSVWPTHMDKEKSNSNWII